MANTHHGGESFLEARLARASVTMICSVTRTMRDPAKDTAQRTKRLQKFILSLLANRSAPTSGMLPPELGILVLKKSMTMVMTTTSVAHSSIRDLDRGNVQNAARIRQDTPLEKGD